MDLVRLIIEAKKEETKERLRLAAFIGWQMGAGGKIKFGAYLRRLHLSDEPAKSEKPSSPRSKSAGDARLKSMGIVPQKENKG